MRAFLSVVIAVVSLTSPTEAGEPAPGSVVEVTCKEAPDQRYSCYLPRAYDEKKAWPILYCFSPNARGDLFVNRYRAVCERRGWIVVGSLNSRNGPWPPIAAAINAMWADTEARFRLSRNMRYASGFSGGARVSFSVASQHSDAVAGVIAIGAGLPGREMPSAELAVYLTCGNDDFNKKELDPLSARLKTAGNPMRYKNFEGAHVMPPVAILEEAVEWLDDLAPERQQERFRAGLTDVRALQDQGKPVDAWATLGDLLQKYPDVKGRKEGTRLMKALERDPAVKREVMADKALRKVAVWLEKNATRVKGFKHVHAQAVKKLETIVKKHGGTRAAERARQRLEALPAPN